MRYPTSKLNGIKALLIIGTAFFLNNTTQAVDGFVNYGQTTTGGTGGSTVTVSSRSSLESALKNEDPLIVQVSGMIDLGSSNFRFMSDKTIIGLGSNSGFIGNLTGRDINNVILQNLNFTNPDDDGSGDGLTIDGSTHILVDHCSFYDCADGCLDITHGSDYVTVSWCIFSYTSNTGHNFVNLIGHSDNNASEDAGKLHVTFHHNWWSTLCHERMPRVRFGSVHSYNNYFSCTGNNYCIRGSVESQILSESNYFEGISTPYDYYASSARIRAVGDTMVNCSDVINVNDSVFSPPYSYTLQDPGDARADIIDSAGPGNDSSITGIKVLVNRDSNRAMDLWEWDNTPGANIAIYDRWGGESQQWIVSRAGDGIYSIRSVLPGNLSLDIWLYETEDGANVALYDYLYGTNQLFYITSVGSGYYRISPLHAPDQCVDAFGTENGDNVGTWTYWGGNMQQWEFQNP